VHRRNMDTIGYVRVSTKLQSLALQIDALNSYGASELFRDVGSGTQFDRPGLTNALNRLTHGDTLVVWRIDRLGRIADRVEDIVKSLKSQGIRIVSLAEGIDTSSYRGIRAASFAARFAQNEHEVLVSRTLAGLSSARSRGRVGGRPRSVSVDQALRIKSLHETRMPPKAIAEALNIHISVATIYRVIAGAYDTKPVEQVTKSTVTAGRAKSEQDHKTRLPAKSGAPRAGGRPRAVSVDQALRIKALHATGTRAPYIAEIIGTDVSMATIYRVLAGGYDQPIGAGSEARDRIKKQARIRSASAPIIAKVSGRPRTMSDEDVAEAKHLRCQGLTVREINQETNLWVSNATMYRALAS